MTKKVLSIPQHKTVAGTPSTPDSGYSKIYVKTDGNWYSLDDGGNEVSLSSTSRRHEFVDPYSYCGVAPGGSSESAPVWTITRITINLDGTTVVETATGEWTNRSSLTYT